MIRAAHGYVALVIVLMLVPGADVRAQDARVTEADIDFLVASIRQIHPNPHRLFAPSTFFSAASGDSSCGKSPAAQIVTVRWPPLGASPAGDWQNHQTDSNEIVSRSSKPTLGGSMAAVTPLALHHTCFIVRDLEGTAQKMADAFGIGPWNIWTIEPAVCEVRGQDSPFSFRVALATVGGGTYELITPHRGRSIYDEHLEKHGEGFHHTCLVYPTLEAVGHAKAALRRQGRELVQAGSGGEVFDFAYFAFPEIGSVVEVLYLDAAQLPPPEAIVRPAS